GGASWAAGVGSLGAGTSSHLWYTVSPGRYKPPSLTSFNASSWLMKSLQSSPSSTSSTSLYQEIGDRGWSAITSANSSAEVWNSHVCPLRRQQTHFHVLAD